MILNSLQINQTSFNTPHNSLVISILEDNESYVSIQDKYIKRFNLKRQKTFSFTKNGFFSLIMELEGKISVSLGESEAIVRGAQMALSFGKKIEFIEIKKNGELNLDNIGSELDYIFISSYVMDTFVKTDLRKIKTLTNAKIISNITADRDIQSSDILLIDSYKLTKQGGLGVILYNDELEDSSISEVNLLTLYTCFEGIELQKRNNNIKNIFLENIKNIFKDDLFLFVDPNMCLDNTLHIGLKDIKAREMIITLALDGVYVSNGEGCSLGLMKPSRIIQEMGYSESESRWCLILDFSFDMQEDEINSLILMMHKKYRQIKALIDSQYSE